MKLYAVKEVRDLLEKFNIKIPERHKRTFVEANQLLSQCGNSISIGNDGVESNMVRFVKELEQSIPKMTRDTSDSFEKLQDDRISNPEAEINDVLEYVNETYAVVNNIYDLSNTYNKYQEILQIAVTPFENVDDLKKMATSIKSLWQGLYDWEVLTEQWNLTKFTDIDIEDINKSVEK